MKTDAEVRRYMKERSKGRTQAQAAAKAGMSLGTARKYERAARVPSQLQQPRTYRTHPNPFADDWPWVIEQLGRDPALQAKTLFGLLIEGAPDRYRPGQLRTFQRHVAAWRLEHGPGKEVIFPQVHRPGVAAQSDFTHMGELNISLGGVPFPHLLFHLVFVYSNVEAVRVCFAESFEALVEGLEACLWSLGGVPRQHRTDHLGAAIRPLDAAGQAQARERYAAVMRHYGMEPTVNNAGVAHENGDVEQAHHRDDLFPTVTFRRAYDALAAGRPERADREYVRVLHLAASTSEAEVEAALALLLEQRAAPTLDAVRELVRLPGPAAVPELTATPLDLGVYDRLLGGEGGHA